MSEIDQETNMEIGAVLDHLQLCSPQPEAMARFYAQAYAMRATPEAGGRWLCEGPGRAVAFAPGGVHRMGYAAFRFADAAAWESLRERVPAEALCEPPPGKLLDAPAFALRDPEGNVLVFLHRAPCAVPATGAVPEAYCQHFGLRTSDPARLAAFYERQLGFIVSDRVKDADGVLRACFLRSDRLHHVLALFMAPEGRFDHQSFEAPDWTALRDWADHMGREKLPLVWGVGRHGPGNDVFFMIADPDGNLAEISAEIEVCASDRPAGLWPHEQRTLNQWGAAIMRS
jgi:catechol 2,3-dioxygenase-like lactoylglutathione lyase family enzyme